MTQQPTLRRSTPQTDALDMYRLASLIRAFELRTGELRQDGRIPGDVHLYTGQEGVAVAACRPLRPSDVVTSTHRCHGHALAKGVSPRALFAELLGRDAGACRGRGGSLHVADPAKGFYGGNGIVAAGLPIADGAALASRMRGAGDVVVAFFGDGSVGQGAFHEALNLAGHWHLPVLFLCENNKYAASTRSDGTQLPLSVRARGYDLPYRAIDGDDMLACADAIAEVVAELRVGGDPQIVEADTWRWTGHWEGDAQSYREDDAIAEARQHDPIALLGARLLDDGVEQEALDDVRDEVASAIEDAVAWALEQPEPSPAAMTDFVITQRRPAGRERPTARGRRFRAIDAVHAALREELERDESVFLAGVDLNVGLTRKLQRRWPERVLDTPISETAVVGMAVGAAMAGLRPVVEVLFMDFITVCFDQIANQAAKLQYMTGGGTRMPLTIRTQFGTQTASGPQHSQSLEALLAHIPGLTVVMPATPADTYGLLRAAIQDDNPVVVVEHRGLYDIPGPRPDGPDHLVPIGRARVAREGSDVTLIATARMVHEGERAAEQLAAEGIACELLDLRTIAPLDREAIVASARKTGRVVIAHEAVCDFGIGAEVAAIVAHEAFEALRAPVTRVCAPATPVPYAPSLERRWAPDAAAIAAAARSLCRQPTTDREELR
ncbi:MAG TPA: thiamine pyrophosphate-dependent enzyme [Conexibacter sp.]|nr:thiamine pyrophosphate-dependent enzyme [Conexibacter sp.]